MSLVPGGGAACAAADARVLRGGSARTISQLARAHTTPSEINNVLILFLSFVQGPKSKVSRPNSISTLALGPWTLDIGLIPFHTVPGQRLAADDGVGRSLA